MILLSGFSSSRHSRWQTFSRKLHILFWQMPSKQVDFSGNCHYMRAQSTHNIIFVDGFIRGVHHSRKTQPFWHCCLLIITTVILSQSNATGIRCFLPLKNYSQYKLYKRYLIWGREILLFRKDYYYTFLCVGNLTYKCTILMNSSQTVKRKT